MTMVDRQPDAGRTPSRRRPPGYVWILPMALCALVLAVGGVTLAHRASTPDSRWPQRIVVNDRDYDSAGVLPPGQLPAVTATWSQIATAGPLENPVYASVVPGAAPTVVLVETSLNVYVEYVLVGGP